MRLHSSEQARDTSEVIAILALQHGMGWKGFSEGSELASVIWLGLTGEGHWKRGEFWLPLEQHAGLAAQPKAML